MKMKIHISCETEKERQTALDVLDWLTKQHQTNKIRFKESKKKANGRKHLYLTIL